MITRDFTQALLRTSSAIKVSIPMTARCFARKSITSRICLNSSASLFRPDHILLLATCKGPEDAYPPDTESGLDFLSVAFYDVEDLHILSDNIDVLHPQKTSFFFRKWCFYPMQAACSWAHSMWAKLQKSSDCPPASRLRVLPQGWFAAMLSRRA